MSRRLSLTSLVLVFAATFIAAAEAQDAREPVSIGADVGSAAAGVLMGAGSVDLFAELPLSRAWSLSFEPSLYWASGTGSSVMQVNLETFARFYFNSLFVADRAKPVHWGAFLECGVAVVWETMQANATINVLSVGPEIRGGYRFVLGNSGVFLGPGVGWVALFGTGIGSIGQSYSTNSGVRLALLLGVNLM